MITLLLVSVFFVGIYLVFVGRYASTVSAAEASKRVTLKTCDEVNKFAESHPKGISNNSGSAIILNGYYNVHSSGGATTPTTQYERVADGEYTRVQLICKDSEIAPGRQLKVYIKVLVIDCKTNTSPKDSDIFAKIQDTFPNAISVTYNGMSIKPDVPKAGATEKQYVVASIELDKGAPLANTSLPLDLSKLTGLNNSVHFCSRSKTSGCYPASPGHATFMGMNGKVRTQHLGFAVVYSEAIDLTARINTEVLAPFDGTVDSVGGTVGKGNANIVIKSKDGNSAALLAHIINSPPLTVGATVQVGKPVGKILKDHVHFELWKDGRPVDAGAKFDASQIWANMKKALGK